MKRVLTTLVSLLAMVALLFAGLGWWSARAAPAAPGLVDGRLAPCEPAPHCVCSDAGESSDALHWIEPIALPALAEDTRWRVIREVLAASGGKLERQEQNYLHATYASRLFRFVDDVEMRMDGERLHLRSSSRVGYSDLNANRQRVEDLRARLMVALAGVKS